LADFLTEHARANPDQVALEVDASGGALALSVT
jgi:hypothetical protein